MSRSAQRVFNMRRRLLRERALCDDLKDLDDDLQTFLAFTEAELIAEMIARLPQKSPQRLELPVHNDILLVFERSREAATFSEQWRVHLKRR